MAIDVFRTNRQVRRTLDQVGCGSGRAGKCERRVAKCQAYSKRI